MGVVAAGDVEPGGAQLGLQLGRASRCARGRRRRFGAWYSSLKHPVDLLRAATSAPSPRSVPPGLQHPDASRRSRRRRPGCARAPRDVMTRVERCRRRTAAAWRRRAARRRSASAAISPASTIAANVAACRAHLVGGVVEGDDAGAAPGELEGVAAEAGAGVEHQVARAAAPSLVEADRQHSAAARCGAAWRRCAGIASTSRYCSTVSSAQRLHSSARRTRRRPAAPTRARSSGSSRPRRIAAASASASPAAALQHRVAVAAGDLGQRAAVGGDERRCRSHIASIAGQAEALVEARHDGQLGLGVQLDDALVGDAATRSRCAGAGRADRSGPCSCPAFGLPMIVSVTSRSVRSLAIASSR